MKDFFIVGIGDFADLVADTIENDMNRRIAGYVVDGQYMETDNYRGRPVYKMEEITVHFPPDRYTGVIGFVGSKMYTQRYEKYQKLKELGYEMENIIHSTASISKEAVLGDGNIFFACTVMAYGAKVGCCNVITPKSYICHHVKMGNANYLGPGITTTGYVEIGNFCFLGANSTVNNKVKIADYTFVGGGIFISHNTSQYDVYLPARSLPMKRLRSVDLQIFTRRGRMI